MVSRDLSEGDRGAEETAAAGGESAPHVTFGKPLVRKTARHLVGDLNILFFGGKTAAVGSSWGDMRSKH